MYKYISICVYIYIHIDIMHIYICISLYSFIFFFFILHNSQGFGMVLVYRFMREIYLSTEGSLLRGFELISGRLRVSMIHDHIEIESLYAPWSRFLQRVHRGITCGPY